MVTAMRDAQKWRIVRSRDPKYDGRFVYGVRSTGIFCRPSCPSRRAARRHVVFFEAAAAARARGFRACRRCLPESAKGADPVVGKVLDVCRHMASHPSESLPLAALARLAGLSPHHFQRRFKGIVGVTPRQYADEVRLGTVRTHLKEARNVTDAIYEAGYGSSSRLYERAPSRLGMTPAAYRRGARGETIRYAIAVTPVGRILVAATSKGICRVLLNDTVAALTADLRRDYPSAEIRRDDGGLEKWTRAIRDDLDGKTPLATLPLDIRATAFQRKVWDLLLTIPRGETRSYSEIARAAGKPLAARAVGTACGSNPVALVIPCHRVVRGDGTLGGYGWGIERKKKLLEMERSPAGGARHKEERS